VEPGGDFALTAEFARTLRTVRHLHPTQLWHRVRLGLRRRSWERRAGAIDARYRARAAALRPVPFDHPGLARVAGHRAATRSETTALAAARDALDSRFHFLARTETFGPTVDWQRPDLDAGTRLWKTLLHEHGFATDLARAAVATRDPRYRERLFALARDWRARCPIGCHDFALDAWNARAVATRLIHFAVAGSVLGLRAGDPDAGWLSGEIGLHGLFLRDNLELDLRGNHLLRDAVGLVFANELAGGVPDALGWLERQVAEQVLRDGCHVERAPFYHAVCTQDLLEVRLLLGDATPGWLAEALGRMVGFLEAIALGDGDIPLLGDGWLGEVSVPELVRAARELVSPDPPQAPEHHGGLVPLHAGPWRVVVRAGRHAPDEQMGHAHSDLLSLDASHATARVVTDTGTLVYDAGPERQRVRGTAAHNTLCIDGCEQLEAWGSFRVGRRGRARVVCRGRTGDWRWVSAAHDAYRHLAGRPEPHRLVAVGEPGILILDAVLGEGRHRIESHLHEHPDAARAGIAIAAIGGDDAPGAALLHERFGETRAMPRHRQAADAQLPWLSGWWIAKGALASPVTGLELDAGAARVRLAQLRLALTWRPQATDAQDAFSLCSVSGGSAT
jgi:uncharacterized heparinase superfamily protein